MRESTKFLKEKLEKIVTDIPGLKIRYEYRSALRSHIVEVLPRRYFESSFYYIKYERVLENEFESLFKSEEILFVSEGSLIEIKDPQLSFGYEKENPDL